MTSDRDQLFEALCRRLTASEVVAAWDSLVDAGVTGLRVAEDHGGLGMLLREAEPVMAALGETGTAAPFLESSIVAAGLLSRLAPASALLGRIACKGAVCAIAGLELWSRQALTAEEADRRWVMRGTARLVLHADSAVAVLAVVPLGDHTGLFLVEPHPGWVAASYPTIDGRRASDLTFDGVTGTMLSSDADEAVEAALDEAHACIAAEAAAIMRRLVRDTVEYTKQRRQFGDTVASFQVIQHRLVDMDIQARRASAIARQAMDALDGPAAVRSRLASAAKATAASAGRFVGQQAVQLHGAMGMTQELSLAGLFKRLTAIENELGTRDEVTTRHARLHERLSS